MTLRSSIVLLAALAIGGVAQARFQKNLPSAEPDETLGDFSESIGDLEVRKTALYAEDVTIEDGNTSWHMKEGFVFRVWSSDEDRDDLTAGYVYVGEGSATVRFDDRAEAWRFGNRMLGTGKYSREDLEGLETGEPIQLPMTRFVLLTLDETVHEAFEKLPQVGGGARGEAMEGDTILVLEDRIEVTTARGLDG